MSDQDQSGEVVPGTEDLTFVYDMPVKVQVWLGDATISVRDVLKCGKGSVIPLTQKIGDPFTLLLHNKKIAEGEIVEAGDFLGIKVTKVLKTSEEAIN